MYFITIKNFINVENTEWFEIKEAGRKGSVLSSWLLNTVTTRRVEKEFKGKPKIMTYHHGGGRVDEVQEHVDEWNGIMNNRRLRVTKRKDSSTDRRTGS